MDGREKYLNLENWVPKESDSLLLPEGAFILFIYFSKASRLYFLSSPHLSSNHSPLSSALRPTPTPPAMTFFWSLKV